MEIVITIFLGAWLSVASVLGYVRLKKDLQGDEEDKKK